MKFRARKPLRLGPLRFKVSYRDGGLRFTS
jgi:hypothetical protein